MSKKIIETVVKVLIYVAFFVPLIVIPSSFIFPFIVPKMVMFRSLVVAMLGGYALLCIINWKEYKPKFTPINVVLAVYLLSFAVSTFVGVDPYHSFWDNHERMLGLFSLFHYIAFYYVCTALFKTWTDWKWALRIFLVAGSIVMLIGLMQTQNPDLLLNQGGERVASTLGNPIYVGGYGLFLAFVAFLLFLKEKDSIWRGACALMGIMGVLGMFFSGTRGSMLGLLAGMGAAILGYILVLKNYRKVRFGLIGLGVLIVLLVGLLYGFRKTEFVSKLPAVGRAVNTSLADIQASPRWIAWEIALQSWKEKPLFGWGPNNYFYAFNSHYNPRSLNFGYGETWFDNAHNIIVNTLAVQGAFGLLVYLGIFGVAITSLVISYRRGKLDMHVTVIGSAFVVAHLVGNVTVFENITSYLYFMFWLAILNSLSWKQEQPQENIVDKNKKIIAANPDRVVSGGLVGFVGLMVFILIFIFNIQPARANMMTLNAIKYLNQDPILAVPAVKDALTFASPHIDDIRSDIGRTAAQILSSYHEKLGKDRSNEIFNLVYGELQKNLILHPLDIRNQLTLSQLAQIGYSINSNPQFILDSEKFLDDALTKSPRRQQIMYSLAAMKMQLGKTAQAIALSEETVDDNPAVGESYWRLAYLYKVSGQENKMRETLNLAAKNGIVFSDQEKSIIAQIITPTSSTTKK